MENNQPIIAQAVVTDPLDAKAGGYMLVAKSPSIKAEDADYFSVSPGISQYLHDLKETEQSYFSFFALPSKQYALVHRFIHGKRRGVNRVVVHLLVLSDDLLRTIQDNIWLLTTGEHFQIVGDTQQPVSLTQLGEKLIQPDLKQLPDLLCLLPDNQGQNPFERLGDRRNCLLNNSNSSKEKLRHNLIGILEALVQGKLVLLPQNRESAELLALAWLSLPVGERRNISWTTHLTPGRITFKLANTPEPNEARLLYPQPENCLLPKELDKLAAHAHEVVQVLADKIMTGTPEQLQDIYQILHENGLNLLTDIDAIDRSWSMLYSEHVFQHFLNKGVSTPQALSDNLSQYEVLAQNGEQWEGLDIMVLFGVCMTGANWSSTSASLENTLEEMSPLITAKVEKCLAPALVTEFINEYSSFETALIAMGLAWLKRGLSAQERHDLFSLFFSKYKLIERLSNEEIVSLVAKLSLDLIIDSPKEINLEEPALLTFQAIVDNNPTVLDNAWESIKNQTTKTFSLYATIALLYIAERAKRIDIVADIMILLISSSETSEEIIKEILERNHSASRLIFEKMAPQVRQNEIVEILEKWMPRISELGDKHGGHELLVIFKGLADKFAIYKEHPATYMRFAACYIAGQKRRGQLKTLEDAANRLISVYYVMEKQPSRDIFIKEIFIKEGILVLFDKSELSQLSQGFSQNKALSFVMNLALSQV